MNALMTTAVEECRSSSSGGSVGGHAQPEANAPSPTTIIPLSPFFSCAPCHFAHLLNLSIQHFVHFRSREKCGELAKRHWSITSTNSMLLPDHSIFSLFSTSIFPNFSCKLHPPLLHRPLGTIPTPKNVNDGIPPQSEYPNIILQK